MELSGLAVYFGLFAAALVAATLLPAQSELALAALVAAGSQPAWALILIASLGNILGSTVNWVLGRYFSHFAHRRWFPVKGDNLARVSAWYRRYGRWSLLLSWAPIIGDPLTLVAGLLREPLESFLVIVGLAKVTRYMVVAAMAGSWLS